MNKISLPASTIPHSTCQETTEKYTQKTITMDEWINE